MARMHSRRKGKSGSTKPTEMVLHSWIRYKPKEVELLIVKLAKKGMSPSKIGMKLRDTYGIPDVKLITGKKITKILEEKDLLAEFPEDLMALLQKVVALKKHIKENKKDKVAKRGLTLTESKVRRLVKYYKRIGRIPQDWKYQPKKVSLLVE